MEQSAAREHLESERARLAGLRDELERSGLSELSGSDQHQADGGTETFDRERDLSIYGQVSAELADVEHALRRLEEGTYGTCEACGRPIASDRLEAIPAA